MGFKDTDPLQDLRRLSHVLDELGAMAEHSVRRIKARTGLPIVNARQLDEFDLRPDEAVFVERVYDRFAPHPSSRKGANSSSH